MRKRERVALYKPIFKDSEAVKIVKSFIRDSNWRTAGDLERLELIRKINTDLSAAYMVTLPVITVWVRDSHYVTQTEEIYLTDPDLEDFLHQFRHHLQNIERRYERRGLTVEGATDPQVQKLPYTDTDHRMYGEDDARAWVTAVIELAQGIED